MGIDVNDQKKSKNSGFKSCHQWAKDHPLIACVVTFLCLLYMFFLSLFSILFYTLPFVICGAILLGRSQIKSDRQNRDIKHSKKEDDQTVAPKVTKTTLRTTSYYKRRPHLQPQMSRRTFGKDKNFIEDVGITKSQPQEENSDDEDDFESFTRKYGAIEPESPTLSTVETITVTYVNDSPDKCASKSMENTIITSRSDIESLDVSKDDEQHKEDTKKMVRWTENDEKNLMDLGSSEIERHKRLESLIAKRRARKLLSMQPRRNHIDYWREFSDFDHQHLDSVGSLMVAKMTGDAEQQSVSSPFSWLPQRDPYDIPYELLEERPVLTGGSFEEDFFSRVTDQLSEFSLVGETNPFIEPKKDSLPSFFTKTRTNDDPGSSQLRRNSDDEEIVKDIEGKTSIGDDYTSDQEESTQKVRPHDHALSELPEGESHKLDADTSSQNSEREIALLGSIVSKKEDESGAVHSEVNGSQVDREATVDKNGSHLTQDQPSVKEGDNDGVVSSSSFPCETNINDTKNEAFRNAVKKVLTCLVKRKGLVGKEKVSASTSDLLDDSSPTTNIASEMEERSPYIGKNQHKPTHSIVSDMQVEVSDTVSPKSTACDPNSPTNQESSVYDGAIERDVNSGEEDLRVASPHPMKLGDSGTKLKMMPDVIEEGNNTRSKIEPVHTTIDSPNVLRIEDEVEQALDGAEPPSLSPRSILPEDNRNDLLNQKSTNGDIVQPASSSPSSLERLDSQMQNKAVNLAEYLANIPPSESSSNVLEDPWQTHVRGTSQEEITLQAENNPVLEMDEDKEDSKERKELEVSKESSDQSSGTSQSEAPKEEHITSNEQHELKKEQKEQVPNIIEDNQHSKVESTPLEKDVTENKGLREPEYNDKEVTFDSYSTHNKEDIAPNPSKSTEASGESELGRTSTNQVEGEVNVEPPNNTVIHETSTWKGIAEANQHGMDQQEVDSNKEDSVKAP